MELTVSSYQMADTWVPNMMEVKREKRRPSKRRKRMKMMVAGGEKAEQVCHSVLRQPIWKTRHLSAGPINIKLTCQATRSQN